MPHAPRARPTERPPSTLNTRRRRHRSGSGSGVLSSSSTQWLSRRPSQKEGCLPPGRYLCFVGDSHSRNLHNSIVPWMRNYEVKVNNSAKGVLNFRRTSYFKVVWGTDWPAASNSTKSRADPLVAKKCWDVVANVGQWALSVWASTEPHSTARYVEAVTTVRRTLLALARRHNI